MTPQLTGPATEPSDDEDGVRVVELPAATGTTRVDLPEDADAGEAAAIAAAVAAHLAAEANGVDDAGAGTADLWSLCGRIGSGRLTRLPCECRRGDEWSFAGRLANR